MCACVCVATIVPPPPAATRPCNAIDDERRIAASRLLFGHGGQFIRYGRAAQHSTAQHSTAQHSTVVSRRLQLESRQEIETFCVLLLESSSLSLLRCCSRARGGGGPICSRTHHTLKPNFYLHHCRRPRECRAHAPHMTFEICPSASRTRTCL